MSRYLFACFVVVALTAWARPASAQIPSELLGQRVVQVEVAGQTEGRTEARELGIPLGSRVTRRLIRSAIARLVDTGRWRDVQIDLVASGAGVRVVAHLTPRVLLLRVDIVQNAVLDTDEIARGLGMSAGSELIAEELDEQATNVESLYRERGYESARAELIVRDTDDPSTKVLIVRMHEGAPTPVAAVVFRGDLPPDESHGVSELDFEAGDVLDRPLIEESIRAAELVMRERRWYEARLSAPTYRRTNRGVDVVIPSHAGPRYEIDLRNYGPLTRSEVEAAVGLGEDRLTAATMDSARERVVDLYRQYGFHDVSAEVRRVAGEREGTAKLVVEIVPGEHLRVLAIAFTGATHFETDFLRTQVFSYLQEELPGSSILYPVDTETVDAMGFGGGRRARREVPPPLVADPTTVYYESAYSDALEHIQALYQADGYLQATVGPARLVRLGPTQAFVDVPVDEGPRAVLHEVVVRGNEELSVREILIAAGLERGQPFSHHSVDEAGTQIRELYQDRGYYYARISPNVRFSRDGTRAELTLEIVESYEVRVGRIIVEGNASTSDALILERLRFTNGDLYRPSDVRRSQERLLELNIFSGVIIAPQDEDLPAQVKSVVVTVTERLPQYIELRGGFSTGQGIRAGFEYGYRNLFGYAVTLSLRADAAYQVLFLGDQEIEDRFEQLPVDERLERTLAAGIAFPHLPIPNLGLSLDGFLLRDNERDFGLDKWGGGATFSWRPWRRFTASIGPAIEKNNVDLFVSGRLDEYLRENMDPRLERLLRVPEGESTIVAVETTASLDFRDSPFNPTRGFFTSVSAEFARTLATENEAGIEPFSSNFIKFAGTVSAYVPIPGDMVVAGQLRLGRVFHLDSESKTYPNRAFRVGGVDTLRGYNQDALIPEDVAQQVAGDPALGPNDVVRAGDVFVVVRAELRFPIVGALRGGVFADIGNLWADPDVVFESFTVRPTAGVGLRFETPVGPIALDYGFNLARRRSLGESLGAFHFSIGLF